MEKTIIEEFIFLIEKSGKNISDLGFSKGASLAEINTIEKEIGQDIPTSLKTFLTYINGQKTSDFCFLPDQTLLLSTQEIIQEWKSQQEYAELSEPFYNDFHCDNKIRCTIHHSTKIPFAVQEGAGFLAIDNDPGPNGQKGQIIYLVNECDFVVFADSFEDFIMNYVNCMHNGKLKFEKEKEGYLNKYRLTSGDEFMDGKTFVNIFKS